MQNELCRMPNAEWPKDRSTVEQEAAHSSLLGRDSSRPPRMAPRVLPAPRLILRVRPRMAARLRSWPCPVIGRARPILPSRSADSAADSAAAIYRAPTSRALPQRLTGAASFFHYRRAAAYFLLKMGLRAARPFA